MGKKTFVFLYFLSSGLTTSRGLNCWQPTSMKYLCWSNRTVRFKIWERWCLEGGLWLESGVFRNIFSATVYSLWKMHTPNSISISLPTAPNTEVRCQSVKCTDFKCIKFTLKFSYFCSIESWTLQIWHEFHPTMWSQIIQCRRICFISPCEKKWWCFHAAQTSSQSDHSLSCQRMDF